MKKSLLALLLLAILLTVSTASAKKYTPDDEIHLFVDRELFWQSLQKSEIGNQIKSYDIGTDFSRVTMSEYSWEHYTLEGDIVIINLLDSNREKITCIGINFPNSYSATDAKVLSIFGQVLKSSGLPFDEYDEAMKSVRETGRYENESYCLILYKDDYEYEVHAEIYDYYWYADETPYSRMAKYYGYCDANYVGACVPTSSKDLECSDIGVRNFFVVGEDKHNFDGDKNGVCCEPYAAN